MRKPVEPDIDNWAGAWPRRVLVLADERDGATVRAILQASGDGLELVWVADPAQASGCRADVVIVFTGDSCDEVRALAADDPERHVVAITTDPAPDVTQRLLGAGAAAVLARDSLTGGLTAACRLVMSGYVCLPATAREGGRLPALSLRERQVLALISAGLTNAQIAATLFLAESTVKSHAATAFRRLGVNSRRDATALVLGSNDGLRRMVLAARPAENGPGPLRDTRAHA